MKVGTVCFTSDQGLGYLARDFYTHGIVTHPVILAHGRRTDHPEWYPPGTPFVGNYRAPDVFEHLSKCDVVLFFETAFDWQLIPRLSKAGVRTVLMPMIECMPDPLPSIPNLILCPSMLDFHVYTKTEQSYRPDVGMIRPTMAVRTDVCFLPVPVNVPWRQRTRCEVFVHNAGNGGLRGRNGTRQLLDALLRYVKSPARFIIRSQDTNWHEWKGWKDVDIRVGTFPQETLYDEGDCFIFPEKFNGLSLPLQEARAAGMLVMATDRFPMNTWLPTDPLIKPEGYVRTRIAPHLSEFDEAVVSPKMIAAKIDEMYGVDITTFSQEGRAWAARNSWKELAPRYLEVLKG